MNGGALTINAARVALILYLAALAVLVGTRAASGARATPPGGNAGSDGEGNVARHRLARTLWTVGMLAFLVHVAAAFHFVHGWSHGEAVAATARQTRDLFGVDNGLGLWLNYLFTAVWATDVVWWWFDAASYERRSPALGIAVHLFFAFMFFNGAVVFAHGPSRWIGLVGAGVVAARWASARLRTRTR